MYVPRICECGIHFIEYISLVETKKIAQNKHQIEIQTKESYRTRSNDFTRKITEEKQHMHRRRTKTKFQERLYE